MKIISQKENYKYKKIYFLGIMIYKKNKTNIGKRRLEKNEFERWGMPKQTGECLIIANGPSSQSVIENNLNFIKNRTVICVNDSYLSKHYKKIKPRFHVLIDPEYCNTVRAEDRIQRLEHLNSVDWKMTIVMPLSFIENNLVANTVKNPNINFIYVNTSPIDKMDKKSLDDCRINKKMPTAENVVVAAIYTMINLGFKTIYITGVEHNTFQHLFVDQNNVLYIDDGFHFYDNKSTIVPAWKSGVDDLFSVTEYLEAMVKTFSAYKLLKKYADYADTTIYNLTLNSFIDVFPKVDVNSIKDHPKLKGDL